MKIFTDKQFDKYTAGIMESNYREGLKDGRDKGYKAGYDAGMVSDRKGIVMTGSGMYLFDDGKFTAVGARGDSE